MRTVARITVVISTVAVSLTSVGHTCAETNSLIRSMLSPLLVCTRLQGDRIVSLPHAVAVDAMLVDCVPGYAASSDRHLCANLTVADTNAWENCRAYFENVINTMSMQSSE